MRFCDSAFALVLSVTMLAPLSAQSTAQKSASGKRTQSRVVQGGLDPELTKAEEAIQKQDYASAEKTLLGVTTRNPKDFRAWYDLGYVYRATNRPADALTAYQRSLEIDPKTFETQMAAAELLLAEGRQEDALPYLRAAGDLKKDPRTQLLLGDIYARSQPAEAIRAYQAAAALDPRDPRPHVSAGKVLAEQKDWSAAEPEFRAALARDPRSGEAVYGLSRVLVATNRNSEAIEPLQKYLQANGSECEARLVLGNILGESGNRTEAMKQIKQAEACAVAGNQVPVDWRRRLTEAYVNADSPADIARIMEQSLEAEPDNARLHLEYGNMLVKLKKYPEAQGQFLAALQGDAKSPDALFGLAFSAFQNKNYQLTLKALEVRAQTTPDTPSTYFLRATSYDNLKFYPQAIQNYHRFLETAGGKFPTEEWQAKHRLLAIDPKERAK